MWNSVWKTMQKLFITKRPENFLSKTRYSFNKKIVSKICSPRSASWHPECELKTMPYISRQSQRPKPRTKFGSNYTTKNFFSKLFNSSQTVDKKRITQFWEACWSLAEVQNVFAGSTRKITTQLLFQKNLSSIHFLKSFPKKQF